jgi:4-amino-4-deoxy-L-arabinose transferase-like glycosyltransferase
MNSTALRGLLRSALLIAAISLYFVGLGSSSIWDANEAFYVETPREMMESGDYVNPTFNYEPRFNKPVLSYWIVAALYRFFGISVSVQRVPIAIGALVLIACAFFLARAAAVTAPREAAIWAALGLAVAPRLVMFARRILIDISVSAFMALTLLFFALAERFPERRRLFLVLMYVAVGLGVLTKGPVAAAIPGLVFAVYLTLHGELGRIRQMMIPAGIAIALVIVVPWYAALYAQHGWTHITSFLIGENLGRYAEGVGSRQDRGLLFYLPVLFTDSFPWSVFLFPAAIAWLKTRRADNVQPGFRIQSLLWIWILVFVAFFSFSASKQDLYIFPIVPAIAALGGCIVARALGGHARALKWVGRTVAVMAVLVGFLGGGALYLFRTTGAVYTLDGILAMGIIALTGAAVALVLSARGRVRDALLSLGCVAVAVNWVFVWRLLPSFERYKPVPAFARVLEPRLTPEAVVATYDEALPSLVFYLRRHVEQLFEEERLRSLLQSDRPVYAILSRDHYAALSRNLGEATCEIARRPTFDVKLKNVLAREPLPELVLVTNRCEP